MPKTVSFGDEKTAPKTNLSARDVDGIDVGLMGDDLAPKPAGQSQQMLADRVLSNRAGEDVGRHTHGLRTCTVAAGARLDCLAGAVARPGEGQRPPIAAQVMQPKTERTPSSS